VYSLLILLLVPTGAAGLLAGAFGYLPAGTDAGVIGHCGLALVLVGCGVAILQAVSMRRASRRMVDTLAEMTRRAKLDALPEIDGELEPLAEAVNDCLGLAEQSTRDAAMRLKELEIQLRVATAERHHAQAIIYSISDAVLVTDRFDELVLANEAAARLFDFELAEARRKPVEQVVPDSTIVELVRDMRQSRSVNTRRVVEHKMKGGGGERHFKITLSCVNDDAARNDGTSAGVVAVLHDMTKEKEVARMKSDFVSHVSHELRTPLASIKAYVEMLIDGEAEDEKTQREFYDVIQGEANRLSRLIDNILNISRIESGLVKINKQPLSVVVIIKEAMEVIAPQAKAKNITLHESLDPAFYQTPADRDMLYQAVMNLLGNAIKYTKEGGSVTVSTGMDAATRKVVVRVTDTGVGIPAKDLPFVFDKFYRVEENNRIAKGTGLGLSLVKHIIETVHRGQVFVESKVGQGSTFGFSLPLSE
jgi:two-component system phosphate regulon sensor histidine kinase PhoR